MYYQVKQLESRQKLWEKTEMKEKKIKKKYLCIPMRGVSTVR